MTPSEPAFWRKCNSCKKSIGFSTRYYVCSVSTCNGQRTGYVFCSVPCFERHLPGARHKDAAAVEQIAPKGEGAAQGRQPARIIVKPPAGSSPSPAAQISREVLVIASRLKEYIHAR